jgi:hypothetical protein
METKFEPGKRNPANPENNFQFIEHFNYFSSKNFKIVIKYIALSPASVVQFANWRTG